MGTAQPLASTNELELPHQGRQIEDLLSLEWLKRAEQQKFEAILNPFCSAQFIHPILVVPNLNPSSRLQTWGIEIPSSLENCCGQKQSLVYFSQISLRSNQSWSEVKRTPSVALTLAAGACLIRFMDYNTLLACPGTRRGTRIPILVRVKEDKKDTIRVMHYVGETDKSPDLVMPTVPRISLLAHL